jgi:uncharacterized protein YndB with AHSA1/START domain
MDATTNLANEPAERALTLTRIFDAPRGLVFDAWTQPQHLIRWWGPKGFTTPVCEMDVRAGGKYCFRMRSAEGREVWWYGICREIVKPERIVWTCSVDDADGNSISGETLLTVTLEDYAGRTKLTLHQATFASVELRESHTNGWSSAIERLAEYLASA